MTASPETASADQDEGGSPSSAESEIPAEPPEPLECAERTADPGNPPPCDSVDDARSGDSPPVAADISIAIMPGVHGAFDPDWLIGRLSAALRHIPRPVQRVSVLIVDNERMTELNRRHLGTDHTTDVLAFPTSEAGGAIDVDIAICADVARRQAKKCGHRPERELLLYVLHGVLHCAGFDDRGESEAAAMHEEEDRILRAIGVGTTFVDEPAADPRGIEA